MRRRSLLAALLILTSLSASPAGAAGPSGAATSQTATYKTVAVCRSSEGKRVTAFIQLAEANIDVVARMGLREKVTWA